MARLAIYNDFLLEFGRLEQHLQEKVNKTFAKFFEATHAGVHLEKIQGARDRRLKSIRIDVQYRGIVLPPESGDLYTLLKVANHDEAYAWARRQQTSVNWASGAVELRDVVAIEEAIPRLAEQAATASQAPMFGDASDGDLRQLGIDEQILRVARTLTTEEQLDALRGIVPDPQYDVLAALAAGMSPEEVWAEIAVIPGAGQKHDLDDVTAAVERTPKRMVLVTGPDELMDAFSYPFAQWRIYLHPTQQRMAYGSFRGPARVTGGPGTGKTVAVLHRAKHLARMSEADRSILITTFTKTLISSLEDGLRVLIDDENLLRRIDVRHVDRLATQIVSAEHGRPAWLKPDDEKALWQRQITTNGLDVTETFLGQEWRNVVLAQDITDQAGYLGAPRTGRARPLRARQKEMVWGAISGFTEELAARRLWTPETICAEAARLLAGRDIKPYQHIIVDEAQDLAPWAWRLLRAAVPRQPDDLFLAGDTHQRIYSHRVSLRQVGIEVAGRSERLKVNYRTTAEILGWSLGVLRGERIDDMDGSLETLTGCRSDVHGPWPALRELSSGAAEHDHLTSTVRRWLAAGVTADQVGVATRFRNAVDDTVARLRSAGIPAVSLQSRAASDGEVSVTTMHSMKGLEFRCVAVVGVGEHQVPPAAAITPAAEDPVTHQLDLQRERCLLFVACTRAREQLSVSWHGKPSPLLPS